MKSSLATSTTSVLDQFATEPPQRIKLNFQLPFGIALVHEAMELEWCQAYPIDHRQPFDHHLY